jgi:hypothetical protein
MPRQIVSRKDWNAMVSRLDREVQLSLRKELESWLGGTCWEFVEYTPNTLGRVDRMSSPVPCEHAADYQEAFDLDYSGWEISASDG